jgi:hypothetical protein
VSGELRVANGLKAGHSRSAALIAEPDFVYVPTEKAVNWRAIASEESERNVDLQGLAGEPTCRHQLYYGSRAGHVHHKQDGHNPKNPGEVRFAASVFACFLLNLWGHADRLAPSRMVCQRFWGGNELAVGPRIGAPNIIHVPAEEFGHPVGMLCNGNDGIVNPHGSNGVGLLEPTDRTYAEHVKDQQGRQRPINPGQAGFPAGVFSGFDLCLCGHDERVTL